MTSPQSSAGARLLLLAMFASALVVALGTATPAFAATAWWHLSSEEFPTNIAPGKEGLINVVASNLGDAPIEGGKSTVNIGVRLPADLIATGISGPLKNQKQVECSLEALRCTFTGALYPYEEIGITIRVRAQDPPATVAVLPDEATVEGGGAGAVTGAEHVKVSDEVVQYGVQSYELSPFNEDGTPATQAGSQPFELTTTIVMNQTAQRQPVELPKDLTFKLPSGLVGNPTAVTQCSEADFVALVLETNLCPPSSVVGVATVTGNEPLAAHVFTKTVPVFNLVPGHGEPARFGFDVIGSVPIVIDTSVRSGQDYGVDASVSDATQTAGLLSSQVTLWGVPGDPRHNGARGWECVAGGAFEGQIKKPCPSSSEETQKAFLILPTACATDPQTEPVSSSTETDSWAEPGRFLGAEYAWMNGSGQLLGFEGCDQLPFAPGISVSPEQHTASTPTGLSVDVKVPQQSTLQAGSLAEADVRDTTVTLPKGVQLNPSAANGLQACSEAQIGFTGLNAKAETNEFTRNQPTCPEASKLGTVEIKTPLLSHELEGEVYLAEPAPNGEPGKNPFGSLVALYLVAEDPVSGVLVKLAGEGQLSDGTLQISTTFRNAPQVPFEELNLELFGGARASVSTPPACGSYPTQALFTPWSGTGAINVLSPAEEFSITSGVDGSPCPSGALAFSPTFEAGASNGGAGAFAAFKLEIGRPDGDQALGGVSMHLPEGVAALLSSVELCGESQAAADACPAASLVGEATAVAGLGAEPYVERGGRVYITGPYAGAPFGLEIVTPAVAGPFNLGTVTVRSRLYIDRENASVTIVSDPLPTQLRGIPLQLKQVLVDVNRPDFEFNPTNCDPMRVEGTISGAEGASAGVGSGFQVSGCQRLPFAPTLTGATDGHASKANGTYFIVKVTSKGLGQANIAKVDLRLPRALPARLSTLQKACTERVFSADPASCPEGSVIGAATIDTPVLRSALAGPAYLVSHGNAAFPDVEFVLQGEGITLVLDGKTQIKSGVTYSKFESAPDAPFTTFETVLPAGPHSALTANVPARDDYSLCGQDLKMPTTITGQNGSVIERDTKIAVQGCAAVKAAKAKKLTNAQKLTTALRACRKHYRHAGAKRARCERQAHARHPLDKAASRAVTPAAGVGHRGSHNRRATRLPR